MRFHTSSKSCKVLPFNLSDIGEGIAEVTIKEWYVEVGSKVDQFDNICEVQSDKASVTITSKYDGVIKKLHYNVDDVARVGTALVDIEIADDKKAEVNEEYEHLLQSEPGTPPLPDNERPSLHSVSAKKAIEEVTQISSTNAVVSSMNETKKTLATPAVRRLAAEYKLDLNDIPGSGKDGRVLKEDVLQYIEQGLPTRQPEQIKGRAEPQAAMAESTPKQPLTAKGPPPRALLSETRQEKLRGIRKAMVKTMTDALSIPHFGYCDEISADALMRVRKDLKEHCDKLGIKLSFMPFFLKATSMALDEFPVLNSSLDEENITITYKAEHNIGVAMDTSDGLIVPNIKDVRNKSLLDIAGELNELHHLGLSGKLGPSHLTGGTISLSNIGSIGGTYAKPVLLPPQVAIAAIGKIQVLPRFDENGNVYAASIFNISWSADHRVIEGAVMAKFSNLWKSYIENPSAMLLHLR
eukprot:gene4973-21317_t